MKGSFEWLKAAMEADVSTMAERMLLCAIAYYCDADGTCFPSRATLMARANMAKGTYISTMRKLVTNGQVTIEHRQQGERWQSNIYRLNLSSEGVGSKLNQGRVKSDRRVGSNLNQGRVKIEPRGGVKIDPLINKIEQTKEQTKITNQVNPPLPPSAEVGNGSGVGESQSAVESEVRVSDFDWERVQAEALNTGYSRGYDTEDFVDKVDEAVAEIAGWRDLEYIDRLLRQGKTIGDIEAYLTKTLYHIAENKIKCARALAS